MSPNQQPVPTRERILAYLAENHVASVQVLSRAWGLTRADIRYHFNALVEEGLVELIPRDPATPVPRGRPPQLYRLPAVKTSHNLPALCGALLNALQLVPESSRDEVATQIGRELAQGFIPPAGSTQRLNQAVTFLSQHGYRARWEAGLHGPRILLRNCPYAAILQAHPELCSIDQVFLETLAGISLRHTTRINPTTGKPPACIFGSGSSIP